ncbi:MAG: hypothetical protein M1833_006194 [Piccolia ochrophora]|nr:MAG: hypothetical protein M1833_006194 [Piccolia ochrophora]
MSQQYDFVAKIVSLGDSGTGKSSLSIRLCEGRFSQHHDVTIGVEFGSRIVPVGPPASSLTSPSAKKAPTDNSPLPKSPKQPPSQPQKHMKLSIWDTAGQETYKSVTRSYFRGASGALLVFDISRRATFSHVTDWLSDLRQIAEPDIVVVLVGNKSDLASSESESNSRQVSEEEATRWCSDNGVMRYVETSAKSGEGVEAAFLEVAGRIWQNIEAGRYDLADRRSGVKAAGAGGSNRARTVNLGLNDAAAGRRGGCC